MTSPFEEANDADLAEQQRPVTEEDDEVPTPPPVPRDDANEADALEQVAEVPVDDDDYEHG